MTGALLVALYLAAVTVPVPLLLRRARWVVRVPRTALAVWLGLLVSSLAGALLLGCEATEALFGSSRWECCRELLNVLRGHQTKAVPMAASVLLTFGLLLRVLAVVTCEVLRRHRHQLRLAESIDLLGRPVERLGKGTVVVDHECPAAYCVAARGGRIVLTTAALRVLPRAELYAVAAHERAHLSGRHYVLTAVAASFARALPGVPLFTAAGPAVARLVEMAADDAAARNTRGVTVARGLALLVAAGEGRSNLVESTALHASADDVAERINRLLGAAPVDAKRSVTAGAGCLAGLVVVPVVALVGTVSFWC
ncbi:M56 family metallopeptidase [Streptomyces sp. NPDC047315]|uniref:M56 family metallopeptidase n=1 Tax=Streptomyces sp. NPDC047315 TaxID=3155142 RepID=UPI0033F9FBB9